MSKLILEFNLPEDREEADLARRASDMASALFDIRQEVFRPARKHGYSNPEIAAFLNKHPEGCELIALLENLFTEVVNDNNVGDLT